MSGKTAEKSTLVQRYRALLALLALMLVVAPLLIYKTIGYTRSAVLDEIRISSAHTLNLVVENLHGELARFQALPHLLAADPTYRQLWDGDHTPDDLRAINLLLEKNKNITGALDLYIMDTSGLTIAASNWQSERTFIGRNFSFRPYFRDAMQGSLGRYFALGSTSLERGYYFSYPIRQGGKIRGVMVCKIEVGHFEAAWKTARNEIVVTDRDGIVFLSSRPQWLFRHLLPLSAPRLSAISAARQYGTAELSPFNIVKRQPVDEHATLITLKTDRPVQSERTPQGRRITGQTTTRYLQLEHEMRSAGWNVHILAATSAVQIRIWQNVLGMSLLLFGLFTGGALLLERVRRNRERIEFHARARAELELRVEERTLELQQAQSELIQAGKLAALGKLAAGLSHELNQPLAAIRSYSDNAGIFLQRGEPDPATTNLKNISELTERMARIIKHLRTYASKEKIEAGPTDLTGAVREALVLVRHRIDREDVRILDKLPMHQVLVHGGSVRLQQVFVNILTNALDAIAHRDKKQITLTLEEQGELYIVEICDSGKGLTSEEIQRVFDPFFSTKEVGDGVGLGLSISFGIISQFGGRIEAANCAGGGAAFRVGLLKETPAAERTQKEKLPHV